MDGYIQVSRVAGREGESFISPEVQRTKIAGWAELHEVEIVQWWEELDQSGRRRDRPMFQQALARCEAGETGGIVVARLDRFARSAVDPLESIKRLNEAGARLVSVEDNFDGSTPMVQPPLTSGSVRTSYVRVSVRGSSPAVRYFVELI